MIELGTGTARHRGVGPKAALLDEAAAAGLAVPPGVVLPVEELGDLDRASRELAARRVADRVAVRSAFDREDGAGASLAGAYTSVLDVAGGDVAALRAALRRVLDSADDPTGATDATDAVARRDVLVLAMVPAMRAGVAFTERDHEDDLVDHVGGLADRLLAGSERGTREQLAKRRRGERTLPGWRGRLQRLLRGVRGWLGDGDWDVEWADDGARCWLLQVRPITAPPLRDEALTLANHREILPDLPSRFTTAVVADAAPELFGYWRRFDASLPADRDFVDVVAGRPVINLSLLTDTMRILGLPTRFVTDSMGGRAREDVPLDPLRLVTKLPALVPLGLDQLRAVGNGRRAARALHAIVAEPAIAPTRADPAAGLLDDVARFRRIYVTLITGMFALTTAISGPLAVLDALGVAGVLHTRQRTAGTRIWEDLAQIRAVLERRPELLDDLDGAIAERGRPVDPELRRAVDTLLTRHGHRGIYESDLARPRYHEDPTPLLEAVRHGRALPRRPRLPVRAVLAWPLWLQASRAIDAREELRSDAMRVFDVMRQRFLAHGRALVEAGALPPDAELFELDLDDLRHLANGGTLEQADLAARRQERDELADLRLPDLLHRSDDPQTYRRDVEVAPSDTPLRGLGLTDGTVVGTAWLADEPASPPAQLRDDRIVLITRGVDAGWIGTFAQVDAVVVETGGELSHGSIVLRESGTPAVTNVADATARLRTGDRVRVHGRAGTVTRLPID